MSEREGLEMKKWNVTNAEWFILECLWEKGACSSMELVRDMQERMGWAKSTTLTVISRMEGKGLISYTMDGRKKIYETQICREDVVQEETKSFLDRVCHGSVSVLLSALVKQEDLTEKEIEEMHQILMRAREEK